jgi:hypothetical protein
MGRPGRLAADWIRGIVHFMGSGSMQTMFIRFLTQDDRVRGFYELATRARISSFPGEMYQAPIESLRLLEEQHIGYRKATDAEVKEAPDQVRNPAPAAP